MNSETPTPEHGQEPTELHHAVSPIAVPAYDAAAIDRARTLLDEIPEQFGPYRILERLGHGGMGEVYRAEQRTPIRREVALKVIKLGMDTKQVMARFEAERQALALMDHPHIAKVFDAATDEMGRPYFVMEYVKGKPITEYADANHLDIPERLELFSQVCHAIQHAHHKGIIHRDIKPSNILVSTQDGKPLAKVIDFGIAKATAQQLTDKTLFTLHDQFVGTPLYMSPEQADGNADIDTRSDVYSLGVLLYELLTGSTPFSGDEIREAAFDQIKRMIREVDPPKPSTRLSLGTVTLPSLAAARKTEPKRLGLLVRGELDWIVMTALEKDRRRRYDTPNGLADDVQRYLKGEPVEAAPPSWAYRATKFVRKYRGPVTAAALLLMALTSGIFGTSYGLFNARAALEREQQALVKVEEEKDAAQLAQRESESQKQLAEKQTDQLEHQVYRSNLFLTQQSLGHSDFKTARSFLESCPEHLRGWEWNSMWASLDRNATKISVPENREVVGKSPEGAFAILATLRDPGETLTLLSAADGSTVATIKLPDYRRILGADVSRGGQRVAILVVTRDKLTDPESTLHVWDRDAGQVIWSHKSSPKETGYLFSRFGSNNPMSVSISGDGSRVTCQGITPNESEDIKDILRGTPRYVASDATEYPFNSTTGFMVLDVGKSNQPMIMEATGAGHELSPSGKYLMTNWKSVYDLESMEEISSKFPDSWEFVRFGRDEDTALFVDNDSTKHKNRAFFYDLIHQQTIKSFSCTPIVGNGLAYLPSRDCALKFNGNYNNSLQIEDLRLACSTRFGGITEIGGLHIDQFFVDEANSLIFVYTEQAILRFPLPSAAHSLRKASTQTKCVAVSPDGSHTLGMSTDCDGLFAWQVAATGKILDSQLVPVDHNDFSDWQRAYAYNQFAFSHDGQTVAIACHAGIFLWSLNAGHVSTRILAIDSRRSPHSISFSADSSRIAAITKDEECVVFDVNSGRQLNHVQLTCDLPYKIVALTNDAAVVINDDALQFCDLNSGVPLKHSVQVPCSEAAVSGDRKRIATINQGLVEVRSFPELKLFSRWRISQLTDAKLEWLPGDSRLIAIGMDSYSFAVICDPQRGEMLLAVSNAPVDDGQYLPYWVSDWYVQERCGPWSEIPLRDRWGELCRIDAEHEPRLKRGIAKAEELVSDLVPFDNALRTLREEPTLSPVERFAIAAHLASRHEEADSKFKDLKDDYLLPEFMARPAQEIEDAKIRQLVVDKISKYHPDPSDVCEEIWDELCYPNNSAEELEIASKSLDWVRKKFSRDFKTERCGALLLYRQGKHQEAYDLMKSLMESPTGDNDVDAHGWCALALMQSKLGIIDSAWASLQEGLADELGPSFKLRAEAQTLLQSSGRAKSASEDEEIGGS